MKAIILSAGIGTRFGNLTKSMPKSLLNLNDDVTLLGNQVKLLNRCGIDNISVVIGLQGDCWTKENHKKVELICKNIKFNDANVSKKRVYSLFKGIKDFSEGPVLIIDGDVFFEKVVVDKLLESDKENIVLAESIPGDSDKRKIVLGEMRRISGFGVKDKTNSESYFYGGIMKVGGALFKDLKKKVMDKRNQEETLSVIIDSLCKKHEIYVMTAEGRWININTEKDLNHAKQLSEKKDIAVIWDFDGVILDTEPLQITAYKKAFLNQGIEISDKDYSQNTGRKDVFQRICKKYGAQCDFEKWYREKNEIYWKAINKGVNTLPAVDKLLNELYSEGYRMAIVSSTSRMNLLFVLNKIKVRDYFEEIIAFEDTEGGKPSPEPYLKAAERLGVEVKNCIVIEDMDVGVESAKKAGMKCIAVNQTNRVKQSHKGADIVLENLGEMSIGKLKEIMGE